LNGQRSRLPAAQFLFTRFHCLSAEQGDQMPLLQKMSPHLFQKVAQIVAQVCSRPKSRPIHILTIFNDDFLSEIVHRPLMGLLQFLKNLHLASNQMANVVTLPTGSDN
jgi:hypothetical protein